MEAVQILDKAGIPCEVKKWETGSPAIWELEAVVPVNVWRDLPM